MSDREILSIQALGFYRLGYAILGEQFLEDEKNQVDALPKIQAGFTMILNSYEKHWKETGTEMKDRAAAVRAMKIATNRFALRYGYPLPYKVSTELIKEVLPKEAVW